MNISLAITTHNRPAMTIRSFEKVINDPRITEIVIVDDFSEQIQFVTLSEAIRELNCDKIQLMRNSQNLGMSLNKFTAISLCSKNDWVMILDSDNVIDINYLDAFETNCWCGEFLDKNFIFCPCAALPKFDYRILEDKTINRKNVKSLLNDSVVGRSVELLLNTCNYIVNRDTYIDYFYQNDTMKATDTIWHNYNHLKNGGSFYVVPQMTYNHLVHNDSGWRQDRSYNKRKAIEIRQLIERL